MTLRAYRLFPSLRSRILAVVVFGAILPLGLIGWWLSRSAATSAETRLRAQLDSSLVGVGTAMKSRWLLRDADLRLLASNDVVVRLVSKQGSISALDSLFLGSLENEFRPTIAAVVYRDASGGVRWRFGSASSQADGTAGRAESYAEPSVVEVRPILNTSGVKVGDVSTSIRLAALLPVDSIPHVIAGSDLRVYDQATGQQITTRQPQSERASDRWISVRRSLDDPRLDIELAAPASAYLEPFERAARLGLATLLGVAMLATVFSALLASRLTRSLEELVAGAEAVARGDLRKSVQIDDGATEILRLAASFNAMTDSLRSTLEQLAQRESLAAVGEFAASLSHEVRNALTAVTVDIQRAQESVEDKNKARDLMSRALRNTRRLDSIVTGALRVGRSGNAPRERIDILEVLGTVVQLADPVTSQKAEIAINASVNGDGRPAVTGDRIAVEQLFLNLLVNSGQAISSSGHVDIDVSMTREMVVVAVRDNGRGISETDLARLGQPFYTGRPDGTGLGLSIARRIATAHGGDLEIASTPGRGTTATVRLPRALV